MSSTLSTPQKALIVAFHFPPAAGSSGVQRAFSLARYLPDYHWIPLVLSAAPRAHESLNDKLLEKLPANLSVKRAFALDSARHLSIKGRYPDFLAYPDRWISWWLPAVISGLRIIRREKPKVIFSTYPIASAHLVALTLNKLTGIPWVADFRDSMTEDNYPSDPSQRRIFQWIERKTVTKASACIFTAPGAKQMYETRYPTVDQGKFRLVRNGYDNDIFEDAEQNLSQRESKANTSRFVLLHSGVIYPKERDPSWFFEALADLRNGGGISGKSLEVRLRATGHDEFMKGHIERLDLKDIVTLRPPIDYVDAIAEMMSVDGLMLMQSESCNHQIPAKAYEYIRARKQILALTDHAGDTAELLTPIPNAFVSELDSVASIKIAITSLLAEQGQNNTNTPDEIVDSFSRKAQIRHFSEIFDEVSR